MLVLLPLEPLHLDFLSSQFCVHLVARLVHPTLHIGSPSGPCSTWAPRARNPPTCQRLSHFAPLRLYRVKSPLLVSRPGLSPDPAGLIMAHLLTTSSRPLRSGGRTRPCMDHDMRAGDPDRLAHSPSLTRTAWTRTLKSVLDTPSPFRQAHPPLIWNLVLQ